MNNSAGAMSSKQEDSDGATDKLSDKRDIKPMVKTLNRVSRACNACRKQKMRCEGAENPPCRRCRHAGLECLFEKPSREASLTGEAGLERIRSLESHVADIRASQQSVQSTLNEILAHLRGGATYERSPASTYSQPYNAQSPSVQSHPTPTQAAPSLMVDTQSMPPPQSISSNYSLQSIVSPTNRAPMQNQAYGSSSLPTGSSQAANGQSNWHQPMPSDQQGVVYGSYNNHAQSLAMAGSAALRDYGAEDRRKPISNENSAHSSDMEDEDTSELPASGLVAPWEVLRGLASVAIERAAYENLGSAPPSRPRTPSPDPHQRPAKRRRTVVKPRNAPSFPDVVTKGIISEGEARDLFRIFYHGCSTFLSVFDPTYDTYDDLHGRSPFAVDCICMVAAGVRDGGGKPSETYKKCLEEVQTISQATLFSPVTRQEAVQAMILVAGWSENGWLPGGHAVRMALELSMHTAWPRLLKRMQANKAGRTAEDRELVVAARTWFCAYVFEHQISYGTGRPAILKDDESIWQCRLLLQHPLSVEDDMRLVSSVELMAVRERVHNNLSPLDRPIDDMTFQVLRDADAEFQTWYANWDRSFSEKYEDAAFYRQSLTNQRMHAELFHNANALRNINGPEDVVRMPQAQRELALRSIRIARQSLEITVGSPAYREGMKYAVHYTHATATFTATLLLRLARLFPEECDMEEARVHVERLAKLLSEIPAKRYALTLKLMLKRSKQRAQSHSRSPSSARDSRRSLPSAVDASASMIRQGNQSDAFSPTYTQFASPDMQHQHAQGQPGMPTPYANEAVNIDQIWRGFEMAPNEQIPVWLSDQSLGGNSFTQHGMNAFLLPQDYLPPTPQIW
ncbi:hypothetical protein PUNSTDRAFT_80092, partial [Punctularia strigosozonata HHB-11173 SS5]|uniref:uncharacterized protein n=1 Tax=Punctularia strigosozonata (strain HHB-11173) TaxID=741275 RepID=UPI0004417591